MPWASLQVFQGTCLDERAYNSSEQKRKVQLIDGKRSGELAKLTL